MTTRTENLRWIPIWAAALPLVTITTTYIIAWQVDHVRACIPYITGCTSVSSTGRMVPEALVFKAGLVPFSVILILFWHHCATLLELGGQAGARLRSLRLAGAIAAVSAAVYALTLGFKDDAYHDVRRIAIVGFATGTFVAEVIFLWAFRPLRNEATRKLWLWLLILCIALPSLDLFAEVGKLLGAPRKYANNWVNWNAFVVASAWYAVAGRLWSLSGFRARYTVS